MSAPRTAPITPSVLVGAVAAVALAIAGGLAASPPAGDGPLVALAPLPPVPPMQPTTAVGPDSPLAWRLANPAPVLVPEAEANPVAVADKFAARVRSLDERAALRAFEGAPPVIPHAIADMNIQTCRACHATGLRAGDRTARMVSHTYLPNCTQCHVPGVGQFIERAPTPAPNRFVGMRGSGYGGTRAYSGAPPVMPHTTFMRTNCVACHGEHGYDGWRPDHLSRTNCVQCHAPAAQFDQLAPTFGVPDLPEGLSRLIEQGAGTASALAVEVAGGG
ncbi:MAG: nitrate reductase cytochrome c-type subunit [Phycisphaerales bacterium]